MPVRPMLKAVTILVAAATSLTTAFSQSASAGSWTKYAATSPDYPEKVGFHVACTVVKASNDDPIVYPGQPGASHQHTFSANSSLSAYSTPLSLLAASDNCKQQKDHSGYWLPTLFNNGIPLTPYVTRAYYRAGTSRGASVKPMPFGLKMLAGNGMATAPQSARVAGYQCRDVTGNTLPKQNLPPQCPIGDFLEASVTFANCWDGVHLDSADHRSHMAYSDPTTNACPADHPVQVAKLTIAERFPVDSARGTITLSSMNSPLTLHADFMDAWDQPTMNYLTKNCINASIACEGVTDTRMPPVA